MNTAIDVGNTMIKVGYFQGDKLTERFSFPTHPLHNVYKQFEGKHFDNCIISCVVDVPEHLLSYLKMKARRLLVLDENTAIPISIAYKTPATLGKDRIALAVAASAICNNKHILAVSAGSCMTYNFVSDGKFTGGAISPGLGMRLRAMHEFTGQLPLVEAGEQTALIGKDTASSMQSGAVNGLLFEIEGYIEELRKKHKDLAIILSGGDSRYLAGKLKTEVLAEPDAVLLGLNKILNFNAKKVH